MSANQRGATQQLAQDLCATKKSACCSFDSNSNTNLKLAESHFKTFSCNNERFSRTDEAACVQRCGAAPCNGKPGVDTAVLIMNNS